MPPRSGDRRERVCVFIDNGSLYTALYDLGIQCRLDYRRLRKWIINDRIPKIVRFYCGEIRSDKSSKRSSGNYPPMCRTSSYSSDSSTITVQSIKKQGKSLQELMFDGEWDVASAYIRLDGRLAMKKIIAPKFMNRVFDSEVLVG